MNNQTQQPVVMIAPTGARRTQQDNPALPTSLNEIVTCLEECLDVGISAAHLHVRNADQSHSLNVGHYQELLSRVKQRFGEDFTAQVTTEAVGIYNHVQQTALIRALKPRCVSIAISEIFPGEEARSNFAALTAFMKQERIAPQYIAYSAEDLDSIDSLRKSGDLNQEDPWVIAVLGRYTPGQQSSPKDLEPFMKRLKQLQWPWMLCAFGQNEAECLLDANQRGGQMRMGFENSITDETGALAPSNAAQIRRLGVETLKPAAFTQWIRDRVE